MSTSQLPGLWQTLIAALQNAIDPWIFQNPFWLESFLQIYEDSSLKWFEVIGLETSAGKCRQHPPIVRWHRTFLYDRLAWEFSARSSFCGWVTCQLVARPCLLLLKKPLLKHVWTHTFQEHSEHQCTNGHFKTIAAYFQSTWWYLISLHFHLNLHILHESSTSNRQRWLTENYVQ